MGKPNWDTSGLWKAMTAVLSLMLASIFAILLYLPLQNDIDDYFIKKKVQQQQVEQYQHRRIQPVESDPNKVVNGIHLASGMVYDDNFIHIQRSCLSCHSAKLITQNRADKVGWKQIIVWMQETQGLPDLGSSEAPILDYLSTHYAPEESGRRPNLAIDQIEWYILQLD